MRSESLFYFKNKPAFNNSMPTPMDLIFSRLSAAGASAAAGVLMKKQPPRH